MPCVSRGGSVQKEGADLGERVRLVTAMWISQIISMADNILTAFE